MFSISSTLQLKRFQMTTYQPSVSFNNRPTYTGQVNTSQAPAFYPNNSSQAQHYQGTIPTKKLGPVSDPPLKETCCNSCWWIAAAILGLIGLTLAILYGLGVLGGNKASSTTGSNLTNNVVAAGINVNGNNQVSSGYNVNNQNNNVAVNGQTNVSPLTYNTNTATTNPYYTQQNTNTVTQSTQPVANYQNTYAPIAVPTSNYESVQPIASPTTQNVQPVSQTYVSPSNSVGVQPVAYSVNPVAVQTTVQPTYSYVTAPTQQVNTVPVSYVQPIQY